MSQSKPGLISYLQAFSIPLILGVVAALIHANSDQAAYDKLVNFQLGDVHVFGHALTLKFLIDDIFMVFFFGIAAKEITEAALPGGSLNPMRKAVNPLLATIGGVAGPVAAFFVLLKVAHGSDMFPADVEWATLQKGWGIPTATDIALAWLVARAVFGNGHPMINFLLLLAVADDAIGLGIIAVFYGDPLHPAEPKYLLLVLLGMAVAYGMRRASVSRWQPYILVCGPLAWAGLMLAHLHPALALVFIVPFLPGPKRDTGLFAEQDERDRMGDATADDLNIDHSPLHLFEHNLKAFVDFGLFFFAYANAGVAFSGIGPMTWCILGGLVIGKTIGITLMGWLGTKLGFPLPDGAHFRQLVMAGFIAALGLTVALFVSGAAFPDGSALQGQAKMGALFSAGVAFIAIPLGRLFKMKAVAKSSGSTPDPEPAAEAKESVSAGS